MTNPNVKRFWQWFECHAQTYQSLFLLTRPEFKYWIYELYTRLKTYCYNDLCMDIVWNERRHTATIIATAMGSMHMFSAGEQVKWKEKRPHGWQMIALHFSPPPGYQYEQAGPMLREDLIHLDIMPFQPRFEGGTCQIEIYVGEGEKISEDFSIQMGEMVCMLLENEGAGLEIANLNFNYIEDAPVEAQQGLIGISIMPYFPETNTQTDPAANGKEPWQAAGLKRSFS